MHSCPYVRAYIHTYIHTYTHACMHAYIHNAQIRTYILVHSFDLDSYILLQVLESQ